MELPIHLRVVLLTNEYDISSTTNVSLDHFEVEEKIGEGTYSEIFLVRQKQNRKHFTMKRINRAECKSKGSLDMIHREV